MTDPMVSHGHIIYIYIYMQCLPGREGSGRGRMQAVLEVTGSSQHLGHVGIHTHQYTSKTSLNYNKEHRPTSCVMTSHIHDANTL